MIATISADIVRSTSLQTKDLIMLRKGLVDLFEDIQKDFPGFWARIIRGDSIECFVPEYRFSLRIAIMIKLFVKMQVGRLDCSELLQRYGIRFSIGIDEIRYASREEDIIDGEAIYLSGRNLDSISREDDVYSSLEIGRFSCSLNYLMDSYVALLGSLVDSYSAKQAEVIFYKLMGYKEREISSILGIYQSSVNTRSSNAQWRKLQNAIKDFENLNFEVLCG